MKIEHVAMYVNDLEGARNFFEFISSFFAVFVDIGVIFTSQFPISRFYFCLGSIFGNSQYMI